MWKKRNKNVFTFWNCQIEKARTSSNYEREHERLFPTPQKQWVTDNICWSFQCSWYSIIDKYAAREGGDEVWYSIVHEYIGDPAKVPSHIDLLTAVTTYSQWRSQGRGQGSPVLGSPTQTPLGLRPIPRSGGGLAGAPSGAWGGAPTPCVPETAAHRVKLD